MRRTLFGPSAALIVVASLEISQAKEPAEIVGRWMCDKFCFVWDRGSSITIDGEYAVCTNDRGDISKGRLLTNRSVRCFGLVGQLADDKESIQWSNGDIWRRDHRRSF